MRSVRVRIAARFTGPPRPAPQLTAPSEREHKIAATTNAEPAPIARDPSTEVVKPLLYIVVRRTTDWTNEATVRAQLSEGFEPLVDLWNDTFDMPYHHYRQQLKLIAQANFAGVEGAVTAALEDVPPGALIAPVDDDDWFSPEMARVVAANRDERFRGYHWPSLFLEVPPDFDQWLGTWRRRFFKTPVVWLCTTNNHVIENMPGVEPIVGSHIRATEWFIRNEALVKVLDVPLSLQNRNLGSQTLLLFRNKRATMTRSKLIRRHRQYKALYARTHRRLPDWCRPWIVRMAELVQSLHVRRE